MEFEQRLSSSQERVEANQKTFSEQIKNPTRYTYEKGKEINNQGSLDDVREGGGGPFESYTVIGSDT